MRFIQVTTIVALTMLPLLATSTDRLLEQKGQEMREGVELGPSTPRPWPWNHVNGEGFGIDLRYYCEKKYGKRAKEILRDNADAHSWWCYTTGKIDSAVDFSEACRLQYGPFARVGLRSQRDPGSWYCVLVPEDRCMFQQRTRPCTLYRVHLDWYCRVTGSKGAVYDSKVKKWRCGSMKPVKNPFHGIINIAEACTTEYGPGAKARRTKPGLQTAARGGKASLDPKSAWVCDIGIVLGSPK